MLTSMNPITLEVCVASAGDALAAQTGGADRIELNCALESGGLTPSVGLLDAVARATTLPVIAMIRPRPAGFCYSEGEFKTMLADIDAALDRGVAGIAFGVLDARGTIDVARCRLVVARTVGIDVVFHRAFDLTPDPAVALEQLIDVGIDRVLTSGQQPTAIAGTDDIARLHAQAAGRIEVLPGCGITPQHAAELIRRTGCHQLHGSFSTRMVDPSTRHRNLGFGQQYHRTDAHQVRAVRDALDG